MSIGGLADTLREHRPLLLACEAIGWLHMAGKAKADFLRRYGGQPNQYEYQRWFKFESPPFPWSELLQWTQDKYPLHGKAWPSSLTDFVVKHAERDPGLLGLLQAAHGMASGIEKNVPNATSEYLSQDLTHMWLTSPFGHPVRSLLADPPPVLTREGWDDLLRKMKRLLEELRELGNPAPPNVSNDLDGWWQWREGAIGPSGWLREAFLSTLAETRVPNNDVTLWDQSYVAAALFKAAVAGAVLVGESFNWADSGLKYQIRWRVLTIGFGARHYEARAVKIGDWAGAHREIEGFFEKVRRLVEVDVAVGSLIYQDDEVLAFTFPGLRQDGSSEQSVGDDRAQELLEEIESQIDRLAQEYRFETPPLCKVSGSTRSFVPMIAELRSVRDKLAVPIHRQWKIAGDTLGQGHVCPVCQVRFNQPQENDQTENARKQRVCSVCDRRRRGRLDAWLAGDGDTIWISEVADDNDRVALLTLSFDIEPWLEVERVDSLRAQSIFDWRRFNPVLEEYWQKEVHKRRRADNPTSLDEPQFSLEREVIQRLKKAETNQWKLEKRDLLLANLQEGYRHEAERQATWPTYFAKVVEDRSAGMTVHWEEKEIEDNSRWLVHQFFRKLPSPGRIYRFWRTAEAFFDELLGQFCKIAAVHANRWRTRRVMLRPESLQQDWQDRETYTGRFGDGPLELLYLADHKVLLTISNLARCLDPTENKEAFQQARAIELRGENEQHVQALTVQDVAIPEKLGAYAPIIVLDRSPERFRVLVPLERATECVEAAIAKWREEFGRVWDRMPLRVGVVGFRRLTPFQAVVEAARNLEADLDQSRPESWKVLDAKTRDGVTALSLEREGGGQELVLVPTRLRDGRKDVFYPYVQVADWKVRHPRDFRHPNSHVFRHMEDLRRGDGVLVYPSRIAAMFLDTTSRRFEQVEGSYLSDFEEMRETWRLIRDAAPSITAIQGVSSELDDRRRYWQTADGKWFPGGKEQWVALARAVLLDRLKVTGAALDGLTAAARTEGLLWSLEWHLTWLKEGFGE